MYEFREILKWLVLIGVPLSFLGAMPGLFVHSTPILIPLLAPYVAIALSQGIDFTDHWILFGVSQMAYFLVVIWFARLIWKRMRHGKDLDANGSHP